MNSLAGSSGLSMQPNDSFQAPAKSSTGCLRICGVCKSMLGTNYLFTMTWHDCPDKDCPDNIIE